jgi:transposase
MVKNMSLLSQILGFFPRLEFQAVVGRHGAERGAKGFSCWDQFVAMLFCQIGQAKSLREICGGLRSIMGKAVHLGMREAPKRSTLSYANGHRPWEVYEDIFYALLVRGRTMVVTHRPLRFKNRLLSMDATLIDLCLSLFPWADYRQTKGAVKLHCVLDHEGYLPVFAHLTEGKLHEIRVARTLLFPRGSVVAFDLGYWDFTFFGDLCRRGVHFVTRMKEGALYQVVESRPVPQRGDILKDEVVRLSGVGAWIKCPYELRRIEVWLPDKEEVLVLLTNHARFGPTTIAAVYKERWQIELFFKAIKQNLRIKTFVGTSRNALLTQIWTALVAVLVLKILALRSRMGWALSTLVALLRWNLFAYKDLWEWVNDPYAPPPEEPHANQPNLFFSALGQHSHLT